MVSFVSANGPSLTIGRSFFSSRSRASSFAAPFAPSSRPDRSAMPAGLFRDRADLHEPSRGPALGDGDGLLLVLHFDDGVAADGLLRLGERPVADHRQVLLPHAAEAHRLRPPAQPPPFDDLPRDRKS